MLLEGGVPEPYHGDPDYGRDWLERGYFPRLPGPGLWASLAFGLAAANAVLWLAPQGPVLLAIVAICAAGALLVAMPIRGGNESGTLLLPGIGAVAVLGWAAWLAWDFADIGLAHRHLVASLAALLLAIVWDRRRFRYAWSKVVYTSDAWNEESLAAYAEFLAGGGRGPYDDVIARELFRCAAEEALRSREPTAEQTAIMRRYADVLREGLGGRTNAEEARWWNDKVNEIEDYARAISD